MKKAFDEGWGGVIVKTLSLDAAKVRNVTPRYARMLDSNNSVLGAPDWQPGFYSAAITMPSYQARCTLHMATTGAPAARRALHRAAHTLLSAILLLLLAPAFAVRRAIARDHKLQALGARATAHVHAVLASTALVQA